VPLERFRDRTAFVTGGASGIGLGLAEHFAGLGMRVVVADVEREALEAARSRLAERGAEVLALECDVSRPEDVERAAHATEEHFGVVHLLCNNAGVAPVGALDVAALEDWQWCLGVNLLGVVHGLRSFVPRMKAGGEEGHIVNTASIGGLLPLPNMGVYTATKYAIVGMSEVLEAELADTPLGVSVVCPSFVATRLAASGRNRPAELGGDFEVPDFVERSIAGGLPPEAIAALVEHAVREDELWVLPSPEWQPLHARKVARITAAFEAARSRTSDPSD